MVLKVRISRFMLKVDDDMYVQVDRLIRLLKSKKQNERLESYINNDNTSVQQS